MKYYFRTDDQGTILNQAPDTPPIPEFGIVFRCPSDLMPQYDTSGNVNEEPLRGLRSMSLPIEGEEKNKSQLSDSSSPRIDLDNSQSSASSSPYRDLDNSQSSVASSLPGAIEPFQSITPPRDGSQYSSASSTPSFTIRVRHRHTKEDKEETEKTYEITSIGASPSSSPGAHPLPDKLQFSRGIPPMPGSTVSEATEDEPTKPELPPAQPSSSQAWATQPTDWVQLIRKGVNSRKAKLESELKKVASAEQYVKCMETLRDQNNEGVQALAKSYYDPNSEQYISTLANLADVVLGAGNSIHDAVTVDVNAYLSQNPHELS